MVNDSRLRRLVTAAAALTLVVAGCGDDGTSDATGATATEAGGRAVADGAFPVTIEHALGETVLDAAPERVVTLGYGDEDAVAALDVVPVGSIADGGAFTPWYQAAIGDAEVEGFDLLDGFPFEQVAALEPDLIVVMANDVTAADYDRLTGIAPTLAFQTEPFLDAWQDMTVAIGTALGAAEEAESLVADTEAGVLAAGAAHPEWAGRTFAVGVVMSPDEIGVLVSPEENTVRVLTDLGLELAPGAAGLEIGATGFSAFISREQIEVLDADVLVLREGGDGVRAALEADPLFQSLAVVQEGDVVWAEPDLWAAFRSPSVLAIPYALDGLVPLLEELEP